MFNTSQLNFIIIIVKMMMMKCHPPNGQINHHLLTLSQAASEHLLNYMLHDEPLFILEQIQ